MKIFFLENDSFYKIYKTLEKLPDQKKKVACFVDDENTLFDNPRQGTQLNKLIHEKKLEIIRIAKSEKAKRFFQNANLIYEYKYKSAREKKLRLLYFFLFKNDERHPSRMQKTEYIRYAVRAIEYLFIGSILYLIYLFIWPSATITIEPTYTLQDIIYNFRYYPQKTTPFNTEHNQLSIAYQTGSITHTLSMKQSVANLANTQQHARGSITLYNTTSIPYEIIANSTFITDDGLLFKAPKAFKIPPRVSKQTPGQVVLNLIAKDTDIQDNSMGERGNIKQNTKLYIKNLNSSYLLKNIYAKANKDFHGGKTLSKGSVAQSDIDKLHKKLLTQTTKQAKARIKENFRIPDGVLLHFEKLFTVTPQKFTAKQKAGDKSSFVEGNITVTYTFPYVTKTDIIEQFQSYIKARSSDVEKLVDIQTQSLILHNIKALGTGDTANQLIIPTAVTTIQSYNFDSDPHGILSTLKKAAIGKNANDFKKLIKKYPEINTASVKINPFWLSQIPTTKSRVFFTIK